MNILLVLDFASAWKPPSKSLILDAGSHPYAHLLGQHQMCHIPFAISTFAGPTVLARANRRKEKAQLAFHAASSHAANAKRQRTHMLGVLCTSAQPSK